MPGKDEVIVRHESFDSMPAMAMPFRLSSRADLRRLAGGDRIDAAVSMRTEPWTLSSVRIRGRTALVAAPSPLPSGPAVLTVGALLPNTAFVDQQGRSFRLDTWRGRSIVLAFIYTRCRDPAMCPLVSTKFGRMQPSAEARPIHLVEVTLDPRYDRPRVLARYGRLVGADPRYWTMATGNPADVLAFARRFGISSEGDGAGGGLVHSERIVVADPSGRITALIDDPAWQPQDLLADIAAEQGLANAGTHGNPAIRTPTVWSEARDITIVVAILGAFAYITIRIARAIFVDNI